MGKTVSVGDCFTQTGVKLFTDTESTKLELQGLAG